MLELFTSEDELAAALSHEVAHLLAGHARENIDSFILRAIMTTPLLPMFVGAFFAPRLLFTVFTSITANHLLWRHHKRNQEKEADYIGTLLMAEAGFDPAAATAAWKKFAAFTNTAGSSHRPPINIFSTHPSVSSTPFLIPYH